jgi:hypothetical protein
VADLRSRQVSSEQTTAAQPAAAHRFVSVLEEDGLLIIVLGAFALVLIDFALRRDLIVDGWMTLVSGRWIVQHGLPTHDALTTMTKGRRWADQQWLAQLAFYEVWRVGGIKLVMLVHALLATSGIVGAALIARTRGATARSVAWIALPVAFAYYPAASVMRAQSFAFPLFTAVLWLVLADGRRPSRRVFLTLPLLALWANLHGAVLLGAGLVSLAGLVPMVSHRKPTRRGLALLATPWACVFVSPYALHLPAYYEKILVGGDFKQLVTEWAPTTLNLKTAPIYLLALGGLWLLGRAGRHLPTMEQLVLVLTAAFAFDAVRNTAWFGLVALAVLPQLIDRIRNPVDEPRQLNRILATTMLAAVAISVAGVATKPTQWFTSSFPAPAAAAAASAAGQHGQVFATSPEADWLLWSQPELSGRVAYDARFELLSTSQLMQLARFQAQAGNWLKMARRYRVFVLDPSSDHALEHGLIRQLPARVVFSSPQAVVLRRRG